MKEAIEELIKKWGGELDTLNPTLDCYDQSEVRIKIREHIGDIRDFISDLTNLLKQNQ